MSTCSKLSSLFHELAIEMLRGYTGDLVQILRSILPFTCPIFVPLVILVASAYYLALRYGYFFLILLML